MKKRTCTSDRSFSWSHRTLLIIVSSVLFRLSCTPSAIDTIHREGRRMYLRTQIIILKSEIIVESYIPNSMV